MSTFGDTTPGTSFTGGLAADRSLLLSAVLSQAGYAQAVTINVRNTGTSIQAFTPVIYSVVSGNPNALIASAPTALTAPGMTATFVTVPFDAAVQLSPGTYAIGALLGPTGGGLAFGRTAGSGTTWSAIDSFADGPAPTYPGVASITSTTDSLSVAVTYSLVTTPRGDRKQNFAGAI